MPERRTHRGCGKRCLRCWQNRLVHSKNHFKDCKAHPFRGPVEQQQEDAESSVATTAALTLPPPEEKDGLELSDAMGFIEENKEDCDYCNKLEEPGKDDQDNDDEYPQVDEVAEALQALGLLMPESERDDVVADDDDDDDVDVNKTRTRSNVL